MKKYYSIFMVAALVSAFTFTSCLDEETGPVEYMSLVTIDHSMGMGVMYPDENPEQQFYYTGDLSQYGISANATRALITYTLPGAMDWSAPYVEITLKAGQCQEWPVAKITDVNYADTCAAYTSAISQFSNYGVGSIVFPALYVAKNRYMNIGYNYRANKVGNVVLVPNRVSNDTVYFDFKLKKEGDNLSSGAMMTCFDMDSAYRMFSQAVAKDDSLHVTVVALTSEATEIMEAQKDSVTTRIKSIY